jgi:glycyl-tRNA synthetase
MLALSKRAISIIAAATTQKTCSSKISSSLHFTFSLSSSSMASTTEQTLRESLASKLSAVEIQANTVRSLKSSSAPKPDIDAAVQALNALKLEKSSIEKSLQSLLSGTGNGSDSREAFRQSVVNTLERRLFYIPSFKIYRGVAGLYDYGPPGCAVKSNVLSFWRQVDYQQLTD